MYHLMKLVGDDADNRSLVNRALWWKAYSDHIIDEIRRLRGKFSARLKKSCNQGM